MNWNVLRYVIAIEEEGGFSKAARRLYLAQPSLSQSIAALEQELGTPLFDRSVNPPRLTHAGTIFLEWARDALRGQEQTVRRIADFTDGSQTHLTIGVSPSRSAYLLPPVIVRLQTLRPNCSVTLFERSTRELWEPFEQGRLDLLLDIPHRELMGVESVLLGHEQLMLAVPKNLECPIRQPGGEFPTACLADYRNHPFVALSPGQMLREYCISLCEQSGFHPRIALECYGLQTAYEMVEAGVGVSILPEFFIRHATQKREACCCLLDGAPAARDIAVSYRGERYLSRDAQLLIELLQEMLA